jgi:uncharacterized LabA/DUF88 family protein
MKDFKFELNGKTWVIIDWANVHGWFQSTKWEIDPKKLYNYLRAYKNICEMRLYFGIDNTTDITRNAYKELESSGFTLISKEVKFVPVSLKDSPFKATYKNVSEKLNKIEEGLKTIDDFIENLNGQLENLKGPQMGYDLIHKRNTYVGIDFTPIEDALKILDFISEDFTNLQMTFSELYRIITKEIKRRKCDLDVEITRDIYTNFNEIDTLILFSGDGDFKAIIEDFIKNGKKVIVVFGAGHLGKEIQQLSNGIFKCNVALLREFVSK